MRLQKSYRILIATFITVIFVLAVLWIFSPFSKVQSLKIVSSVQIDSSCDTIYDFLGNSNNAKDWSSFVAFIETINPSDMQDGAVGSKRICYTQSDKNGFNWEEEVVSNIPNKYRELSCYNFKNLDFKNEDLITEQIYKQNENGCLLTFTLKYKEEPSWWSVVKIKFAAYRIESIFNQNLQNIKKLIENPKTY